MDPVVIAASDGTPACDHVVRAAERRARRLGARLAVAIVLPRPTARVLPFVSGRLPSHRDAARRVADDVAAVVGRSPGDIEVLVREGNVSEELVHLAREIEPALIVVGGPRLDGAFDVFRRAVVGSVAASVCRRASRPVLVARTTAQDGQPVLAATDLTDPERPAIAHALAEAAALRSPVVLLHVLQQPATRFDAFDAARARASATLHGAIAAHDGRRDVRIAIGPVGLAIEAAVEEIRPRLLVIGAGPRGGGRGSHGHIVEDVLGSVTCPVLVVPLKRACAGLLTSA